MSEEKNGLTDKSPAQRVALLDHIDKLFALREKQRVLLQQLRDLTVMAGLPETERNSLCAERRVGRPMGFTLKMNKHEKKLRRDALEEAEWRPESSVEAALNAAVIDDLEKERESPPTCDALGCKAPSVKIDPDSGLPMCRHHYNADQAAKRTFTGLDRPGLPPESPKAYVPDTPGACDCKADWPIEQLCDGCKVFRHMDERDAQATTPAAYAQRDRDYAELKKLRAFVGEIVNTAIPADAAYGVGKLKTIRVQACMLNGTDPQRAYNQDENPYNIRPPIKKLTVDSGSYYAMQRLVCDVATSIIPEMVDYRGRACAVLGINNTFDEDGTPNGSEKTDEEDTDACQTGSTPPEPASP